MSERAIRLWASQWTHVAALSAASLIVLLQYGPLEYPILGDRAYFLYLGQAILRGESIYANSFMGYPPTALLISSAAMWLGTLFDVPTYLAPRFLGIVVAASSVVLVYLVIRRARMSASAGIIAAIALAGSAEFGALSVSNLEPKNLVILLSLASSLALQKRSWWAAGLASGLAVCCWQPAALIGLVSFGVTAWETRHRWRPALARYSLGVILGVLPAMTYLSLGAAWEEFWERLLFQILIPHADSHPLRWMEILFLYYSNELLFFIAAGLGFLGFTVDSLRRRGRPVREAWLDARFGGLPLLTSAWLLFGTFNFQGLPDLLPLLPMAAFWVGWLWDRLTPPVTRVLQRSGATATARSFGLVTLCGGVGIYAFADAFLYEPTLTLEQEREIVRRIVEPAGEDGVVMSFGADELLVLAERASPNRFLRLNRIFELSLPLVEPGGCPSLLRKTLAMRPAVVVTRDWSHQGDCVRRIERQLSKHGYRLRRIRLSARQWQDRFFPDDAHVSSRTWNVYQRNSGRSRFPRGQ